jgi:tRNA-2-methylthio-N6-dimethylallyladenosine synthase
LIETIRDCPQVMEHCHLPMQAGDDRLLQEMKRVYTVESFRAIVDELRAAIPDVGLTTDVIVGFPGETDEMFENTLKTMEEIRFDGAYMFAYSIRPGTPAGDREDQIPAAVKKARLNRMIEMQNRITVENNDQWIGREVEVLVEGPSPKNPDVLQGYSREYRMVHFAGPTNRTGRLARVRVTGTALWGLRGELV